MAYMRTRGWKLAVACGITLGAVSACAQADPVQHDAETLCRQIDADQSPRGVVDAVNAMRDDENIKATIFLAFTEYCPEYTPLMEQAEQTWDMHPCYNGRTGLSDPICARDHQTARRTT